MQLAEFKAWFEGYTEAMTGTPTKVQWARIKERIAEIDGKPITERVFVDRYWPTYWPAYPIPASPHYTRTIYNSSSAIGAATGVALQSGYSKAPTLNVDGTVNSPGFNSTSCMYLLGKQEAVAA